MDTTTVKKVIAALLGCLLGGFLVSVASRAQGGNATAILPYGSVLGSLIGLAVACKWVRPALAAAAVGAISSLTVFQCLPCDGTNFFMPAFGAASGWIGSVLVRLAAVQRRSKPEACGTWDCPSP